MPLFMDRHDHIEGLTAEAAHREAHGLLADRIMPVQERA
jgi:hypothetical protein